MSVERIEAQHGLTQEDRLAGLVAFLPIFEADGFVFAEWDTSEGHFPYCFLTNEASRFYQEVYRLGWIIAFHWSDWAHSSEGQRLLNSHAEVARASVEDLERLLTTHIRADRFTEGHLAGAFESGDLTAILRRADVLLREVRRLDMNQ